MHLQCPKRAILPEVSSSGFIWVCFFTCALKIWWACHGKQTAIIWGRKYHFRDHVITLVILTAFMFHGPRHLDAISLTSLYSTRYSYGGSTVVKKVHSSCGRIVETFSETATLTSMRRAHFHTKWLLGVGLASRKLLQIVTICTVIWLKQRSTYLHGMKIYNVYRKSMACLWPWKERMNPSRNTFYTPLIYLKVGQIFENHTLHSGALSLFRCRDGKIPQGFFRVNPNRWTQGLFFQITLRHQRFPNRGTNLFSTSSNISTKWPFLRPYFQNLQSHTLFELVLWNCLIYYKLFWGSYFNLRQQMCF